MLKSECAITKTLGIVRISVTTGKLSTAAESYLEREGWTNETTPRLTSLSSKVQRRCLRKNSLIIKANRRERFLIEIKHFANSTSRGTEPKFVTKS